MPDYPAVIPMTAQCERARNAGARILSEVDLDKRAKRYRVEDREGHRGCSWSPNDHT